jgi:urease accessory protein UreE
MIIINNREYYSPIENILRFPELKLKESKLEKHARQFNVAEHSDSGIALSKEQLQPMRDIVVEVFCHADTLRQGDWNKPEEGGKKNAFYIISNSRVLVVDSEGMMVTILNHALNNRHLNKAPVIWSK